jgi:hypothetical protein
MSYNFPSQNSQGGNPLTETNGGTNQTSYTTGDLLYASASNTLSKLALPDIGGSQLTYNGTNVKWDGPWNSFYMYEEFIQGQTTNLFEYQWFATAPGASNIGSVESTAGHPGIFELSSSGNSPQLWCYNTSGAGFATIVLGAGVTEITWLIKLSNLSDVTDRFTLSVGLNNGNGRFCGFRYVDNVNSGNWQIISTDSGGNTTSNTSTAATTNWTGLRMRANAAGNSLAFYVNGTQVANSPITTNITTEALGPYVLLNRSAGTNSRSVFCDAFSAYTSFTNPRNS